MQIITENKNMTVMLSGEIDHHTAAGIRNKIDCAITTEKPEKLLLDFSGVTFMDSSGVGLVIGRYKRAAAMNCETAVMGLSARDNRIMKMSGLEKIIEFR